MPAQGGGLGGAPSAGCAQAGGELDQLSGGGWAQPGGGGGDGPAGGGWDQP
jgi:hypothetical protein